MDANALLAIYTKVQQIYNDDDSSKFLSFPLDAQYIFSPERLNLFFGDDAAEAASSLNQRADFSRNMNRPVKSLFPSAGTGELLWEVYQGILTTAEIAENAMSEDEKEAFRKAEEFLFVEDENGLSVHSEKYRRYCEFRDRDFTYREEISNLELSETLTETQRDLELAKLRKALAENEELWSAGGLRQEVEKLLEFRKTVLANSPVNAWARLKDKCLADLSVQTDLSGGSFASTVVFPNDVLNQPWCSIDVGKEEVATLLDQASSDLRTRLRSDYKDPIESISFEYRSVGIQRPWFDSDLFKSRLWRLPNSSDQKISYGSDKLLGRFPAYISGLLLLKDFRITYASGKTGISFGSLTDRKGADGEVAVLAYICKILPVSPNPDESAHWLTTRSTARFQLEQKAGGTLHAYVGNEEVDSGLFAIGTKFRIKAVADENCILPQWKVNGACVDNLDYSLECTLEEGGLTVIPCWEYGDTLDPAHFKVLDDKLVFVDKGPATLDMNRFSALCRVKVIGEKAFENYANLESVTFGKTVEIIGEQVFPNCTNLEAVFLPLTTQSVHKRAFVRNGFQEDPFVWVNPAHEKYTALNGVLIDKKKTQSVRAAACTCGAKFFYSDEAPAVCPKCGAALDPSKSREITIRRPDAKVPFRITEQEARDLVRGRYAQERHAEKDFRALVAQSDIPLHAVYVPLWEWRIQADSAGREDSPAMEPAVRDANIAVPASQIVGDDIIDTNELYTEGFQFGHAPAQTTFELCSQSLRECQKAQKQLILDSLRRKAGAPADASAPDPVNYVSETNRLVYHPYWVGSLEYKGESHPFYVDGYSRKVTLRKAVPKDRKSPWIVLACVLAGLALAALAFFLIRGLVSNRADTRAPAVSDRTLLVTDPASDGFTLGWTKAKDNATPADSIRYQVFLKGDGDPFWRLVHEGLGISSYRFSGLTPETRYAFFVTAGDKAGNSFRYSDGETTVEDCDPPAVGSKAFRALPFEKSIVLRWEKALDNVTPEDKIDYQILLKGPGETGWRTVEEHQGLASFQCTGLTPDTEYTCTLQAKDEKGLVAAYDTLTLRTLASSANIPEATAYEVVLVDAGPSADEVVKAVRSQTGRNLNAARDLVAKAPVTVKSRISKTKAAALQDILTKAGATVEVVNRK